MPQPSIRRPVINGEDLHYVFGDILFETDEITLVSNKIKKSDVLFNQKLNEAMSVLDEISQQIKDNDYLKLCNILNDLKTLGRY